MRLSSKLAARVGAWVLATSAATLTGPVWADGPVTINVVDVAGNLALTQKAFEAFRDKNPNLVSQITFTNAPAPQLPGKIKAMQGAGRSDIDLVLTGTDALAAGIEQNLWMKLLPDQDKQFPGVLDKYAPGPRKMQDLAQGQGLEVTYMPAGPLLEYNPAHVSDPPKTPDQLLTWCKATPSMAGTRPGHS
jgi:putative spermidine/putrescine transport system substrate-binding protein